MNLVALLQTLIATPGIGGRRGLRGLLWGKPGVGKTAAVESLCHAMGVHIYTIIASLREPADFLGIPMPDGKGGLVYAAPAWVRWANTKAAAGEIVVIYLDELTTCPPAVQSALLRVTNEGWVGDTRLHPNVVFIAAANPPEIAAGGYDLPPPMANRWIHIDWPDPSVAEWSAGILSDWAETRNVEPIAAVVEKIEKNFARERSRALGLVTGFLRANSARFIDLPSMDSPDASKAWASGRSWEMAVHALAGAACMGLGVEGDMMLQGAIGQKAAGELRQFETMADLPDPTELLDAKDHRKVWRHDPQRPDVTAAVLNSCAALVCPRNAEDRVARGDNMWKIVGSLTDNCADLSVTAARAIAQAGHNSSSTARKNMVKLGPVMQAMGELTGAR